MAKTNSPKRNAKTDSKGPARKDSALDSILGHPERMPGAGADLASTDMEVLQPSRIKGEN